MYSKTPNCFLKFEYTYTYIRDHIVKFLRKKVYDISWSKYLILKNKRFIIRIIKWRKLKKKFSKFRFLTKWRRPFAFFFRQNSPKMAWCLHWLAEVCTYLRKLLKHFKTNNPAICKLANQWLGGGWTLSGLIRYSAPQQQYRLRCALYGVSEDVHYPLE